MFSGDVGSQWKAGFDISPSMTSVDGCLRLQETLDFLSSISQTRAAQESMGGCVVLATRPCADYPGPELPLAHWNLGGLFQGLTCGVS